MVKNKHFDGRRIKNKAKWYVIEGKEKKYPPRDIPKGEKREAFIKIINKLNWTVVDLDRIKLVAEIPEELVVVLRGIQQDDNFGEMWGNVKETDFKSLISGLYSYYLGELLDKS